MANSNAKLAAASALPVSPDDDGAWYGGGLHQTPRRSGPAPRGSTVRSAPPPPPAAALVHHARSVSGFAPRMREPAFQLPAVPLPSTAYADWIALSSTHYGSSLRPSNKPRVNWRRVSLIGLSAAALVGGLYSAILLDSASRAQISRSRALHVEALGSSREPARAPRLPSEPPSALAAIGPIGMERSHPGAESAIDEIASAEPAVPAASEIASAEPAVPAAGEIASAKAENKSNRATKSHAGHRGRSSRGASSEVAKGEDDIEATPLVATKQQPTPSDENLPERLSRQQVQAGLESVRAALAMCVVPAHGTTYANVTIANSGKVTYSQIEGAFSGTTQGSCMARVLRGASFPRFRSEGFKVRYPFAF